MRDPYGDDGLGGLDEGDEEEEDDHDDDEEILLTPPANFKHALPAGMERTHSDRSAGSGGNFLFVASRFVCCLSCVACCI